MADCVHGCGPTPLEGAAHRRAQRRGGLHGPARLRARHRPAEGPAAREGSVPILERSRQARARPLELTGVRNGPSRGTCAYAEPVLTGLAHTAICVPDVEVATRWYSEVLGLRVLSPPYRMEGAQIEHDMGELVPSPVIVTAAIVGFEKEDRVLELIEYPAVSAADVVPRRLTQ